MSEADESSPPAAERALAFFQDRFDLNDRSLATALDTALERNIDYADLYFEYTTTDSVSLGTRETMRSGSPRERK